MAGLKEQAVWENEIYQIEEDDPVWGGEEGTTNKPTKQLANRTLYLRNLLTSAGQKIVPKTITATSTNTADATGHSHAIAKASTTQAGIIQLADNLTTDDNTKALTAKQGKALQDTKLGNRGNQVLRNGYLTVGDATQWHKLKFPSEQGLFTFETNPAAAHGVENSIRFNMRFDQAGQPTRYLSFPEFPTGETVAYRNWVNAQIKAGMSVFKVPVKGSSAPIILDLTDRAQIIEQIGTAYKGSGRYYFTLHNSGAHHQLANFPLGTLRGPVELIVSAMGAFSFLECYYISLNRRFFTSVNWNESTLVLKWQEMLAINHNGVIDRDVVFKKTLESSYRVAIRRDEAKFTPYLMLVDNSVDVSSELAQKKIIGDVIFRAGVANSTDGKSKGLLRTVLDQDKNATLELGTWNAADSYKIHIKNFSKTGNTVIGSTADNERDRLQVNGTAKATAPADDANNDQLPTTAWVRRMATSYFSMTELGEQDLDNVRNIGWHKQSKNNQSTAARHYPVPNEAGSLEVKPSTYGLGQIFTTFNSNQIWVRNLVSGGRWGAWKQIDGADWGDVRNKPTTLAGYGITDAVKLQDLRSRFANNNITYQDATPAQLPLGSFVGLSTKAGLTASAANGWSLISKGWNDQSGFYSCVRFGITGGKFYFQTARDWNNWNAPVELATAAHFVKKAGDTMTGKLSLPQFGHGAYADQYNSGAPLLVEERGSVARDTYHPFIKGRVRPYGQYGTAFSFGYTSRQGTGDGFGRGVIHLIEDNGTNKVWAFEHNGEFRSAGDVVSGNGKRLNDTYQTTSAYVDTTAENYGGICINRASRTDKMIVESNGENFAFIRRNSNSGHNHYAIFMPNKNGTVLLDNDLVQGGNATSGWCRLPNGLLIQWGQSVGSTKTNWAIAFREIYSVTDSCTVGGQANYDVNLHYSLTQFWGQHQSAIRVIAIGR